MDHSTLSEGPITDRAGWTAHGASDIGHWRGRNEDRFILMPEAAAYIVCDGMGGHPGGAEASRVASQAARDSLAGDERAPADRVSQAVGAAAVAVRRVADETPALARMGTTLTLALLDPTSGHAWLGHVGDSRLYRLRADDFMQITADHSVAWEMARDGLLDPDAARSSGLWHMLSRAIGIAGHDRADIDSFALDGVAAIVLCTDGLSNMVPDAAMDDILRAHPGDPRGACHALIAAALDAGGDDNVTAVVLMPA